MKLDMIRLAVSVLFPHQECIDKIIVESFIRFSQLFGSVCCSCPEDSANWSSMWLYFLKWPEEGSIILLQMVHSVYVDKGE